jgi:CDGSH-type Zn-finger protein/truncated hemoglobin YjbI
MSNISAQLRTLLATATEITASLDSQPGGEQAPLASVRLQDSVIRPLRQALNLTAGDNSVGSKAPATRPPSSDSPSLADAVWRLGQAATRLRVQHPDVPELAEATAALQDLAISLVDDPVAEERLTELKNMQSTLAAQIRLARNGPYLVTNARHLYDWLGTEISLRPQLALCRCGGSKIKPLCDGTHAAIGFTDDKDPNRVADRRDTYVGQQVTVLDNRGTCQHSGFCTDRIPTVFHTGTEPFVTASGGRMDEIIRAVRDCPSGALSYATDGAEARDDVDWHGTREPAIDVSKNGPYRVTGSAPLVDAHGNEMPRNQGASHEHYALCRCGHSQNKPFCSGMHWYVQFRDPIAASDREPTLFEWAGGLPALTRMTRLFYEKHVPQDPLLAPLFAGMSADHPQRVAKWLGEVFGGPKHYSVDYGGYPRMLSQHLGKQLTEDKRARWVTLLLQSAREAGLPNDPEFRSAFSAYIEWGSRLAVENSQSQAKPPEHMPMPHWDWHTAAGPPGSRISALAQPDQDDDADAVLPSAGESISFAKHIKPLFRRSDRQSMSFAFDLWSHEDVSQHADAMLNRLQAGTMPCDGAWPQPKIDVFQRWVATGKPA